MNGEQDILIACNVGDLFWLKRSLPGREKLINKIVNNEGLTPLHLAARQKKVKVLDYLIAHCKGVDVNISTYNTGECPLHLALCNVEGISIESVSECVQLLLQNGAHCNKQNSKGQTSLHLAAQIGYTPVVKILLSHGADITITDQMEKTPYDVACLHGNHECARLLRALNWAKDKDHTSQSKLQQERMRQNQKILYKTIQTKLRQEKAQEAYDEWLYQNHFSPPPCLHESAQTNSSCQTCSRSHVSSRTTLTETSQTNLSRGHDDNPKIATIQISLAQAQRNIESVGKPHKLYPYTNYPPTHYRQHSPQKGHITSKRRPSSSMSSRRSQKRSFSQVSVKSAPTPRTIVTPDLKLTQNLQISKLRSPLINIPHTTSSNEIYSPTINDSHIQPIQAESPMNIVNKLINDEDSCHSDIENDKDDVVNHNNIEAQELEDEGSTSSIDGLTFHEVGPENDLRSLVSPTSAMSPVFTPVDLLQVLGLNTNSTPNKQFRHSSSCSYHRSISRKSQRRFSLGSIPEGEIVTNYVDNDSQIFDEEFLYNLMPFAFQDQFHGVKEQTENQPLPLASPVTSQKQRPTALFPLPTTSILTNHNQDTPTGTLNVVTVAWDTEGIHQNVIHQPLSPRSKGVLTTPTTGVTSQSPTKQSPLKKTTSTPVWVKSSTPPLTTPVRTSIFEFGGKLRYT